MIEWITAEGFKRTYAAMQDAHLYFDVQIAFDISLTDLINLIPFPSESYPGGLEEPGPCERWYGQTHGLLFSLTGYDQSDFATILTRPAHFPNGQYLWSILYNFIDLPRPLLQHISWIRGYNEDARASVCRKDKDSIIREVYRAKSHVEARELLSFLQPLDFGDRYFIQEPEDLTSTWVIIRKEPGHVDQIVGRYTLRGSAEYAALLMLERDPQVYEVRKEQEEG